MFAAEIQREWSKLGVGGSSEDVVRIVHVLSGTGMLLFARHLFFAKVQICTFADSYNFAFLGAWPSKQIKNVDVIRMYCACEIMQVCPRQSIYFMAINALGKKTVKINS